MREERYTVASYATDFATEACIHIPGPRNVSAQAVLIFPTLAICLDRGAVSDFSIPTKDLTEFKTYGPTTVRFCLARH